MTNYYPFTGVQEARLAEHPRVSAAFALDKNLWDSREVAVVCISRGTMRQRTERRIYYGTLVLSAGNSDQIGVRHRNNGEVSLLHKSRAVDVYDMTRKVQK